LQDSQQQQQLNFLALKKHHFIIKQRSLQLVFVGNMGQNPTG
jgi:hypothetical protein